MNRVYKVIWSKAKHCYVVTSEIARSVTKSASSARSAGRKGAAVLAMAALLFTAGGVLGEAADVVTDVSGSIEAKDVILVKKEDGTTTPITINDVEHAIKATSDGDGLIIKENYVKNTDARVSTDGEYVKKDKKVGENLSALDAQVKKNTMAVVGVMEAGEKVGEKLTDLDKQVKVNADAVAAEETARKQADQNNLKIEGDDGVISKVTGNDGTKSSAVNKLVLNKDDKNQITLSGDGIKVGLNSGVMDKDGFYAGGDDYEHAGAALKWDGSVKGANGDFEVNTGGSIKGAGGKFTVDKDGNADIGGDLTVDKNLTVSGTFDSKTLSSTVVPDINYTTINGGKTVSMNQKNDVKTGETQASASTFDENGSNAWAKDDDSIGKSTVTADGISQKLSDTGDSPTVYAERTMSQGTDTKSKYSMVDTVKDGDKTNVASQTASESSSVVSGKDGKNSYNSYITQNMKKILQKIEDGDGNVLTSTEQTETDITNEAKNKITNKARDVETDAASSIVQKVTNDYGSNTSTQLSHQTKEEMSRAGGKTASYLRGAVEEKSELIDGDVKTTIDTIAGQTNTNITKGKNVSNSLQEADKIASSVTDGTNTTGVNQDARSLASSITDGPTKFNNSFHWVDGSAQRIEVDDTHFYAETRTAETAVETLKSGKTQINIVKDTNTATVSSAVNDDETITGISQNAKDISLSAAGGTITNTAKKLVNTATGDMENKVGGNLTNNVTGNMTSNVTGDSSLSAKNISNTATVKLSNSAANIENTATKSITDKVGENTSWKMTDGKISESIVKGTASNKENTTVDGTKRIITNDKGTGIYNQTATSNNISLKNAAGDTYFTKSESLDGEKTSVKNSNGSSTINQSAESIVNFVKNSEGTTKTEQSAVDIKNTAKNGTITNDAKTLRNKASESITDKVGENVKRTMTTDKISESVKDGTNTSTLSQLADKVNTSLKEVDGEGKTTKYLNNVKTVSEDTTKMTDAASGAFSKRSQTVLQIQDKVGKTTVTITNNGLAVTGGTTTDTLTVTGTSEFRGKADFKDNVSMGNDLAVKGETRTGTLHVENGGYVGGDLIVDGNIETHDAVLSADSRQVVTGRQLYQTNERVDRLDNRIKKVGANAAALAALRPGDFNPDDKFSIAAGFGSYRNANAAALGLFYRPNENVLLSLGTSFGDGENMVNAGVSVKFGRGKSMAERRKEMADEVSSMRDEMRSQDERIAELEEMLKKQSELIEKLSKES